MSLLEGKKGDFVIEYQLPLSFDKQLQMIDDVARMYDQKDEVSSDGTLYLRAVPNFQKTWNYIKANIKITKLDGEKETLIWKGGALIEEGYGGMLKASFDASKFFLESFEVFIKDQGLTS
jgi:hypothetical protein